MAKSATIARRTLNKRKQTFVRRRLHAFLEGVS